MSAKGRPSYEDLALGLCQARLPDELLATLTAATPFIFDEAVEMAARTVKDLLADVAPVLASVDSVSALLHGHPAAKSLLLDVFWWAIILDHITLRFARKLQHTDTSASGDSEGATGGRPLRSIPLCSLVGASNGILSPQQMWAAEKKRTTAAELAARPAMSPISARTSDSGAGDSNSVEAGASCPELEQPDACYTGWRVLFERMADHWGQLYLSLILGDDKDTQAQERDMDLDADSSLHHPSSLALSKRYREAQMVLNGGKGRHGSEALLACFRVLAVEVIVTLFHSLWAAPPLGPSSSSSASAMHQASGQPRRRNQHNQQVRFSPHLEPGPLRDRVGLLVDELLFGAHPAFPELELQQQALLLRHLHHLPPALPPSLLKPKKPFSYSSPPTQWRDWMAILDRQHVDDAYVVASVQQSRRVSAATLATSRSAPRLLHVTQVKPGVGSLGSGKRAASVASLASARLSSVSPVHRARATARTPVTATATSGHPNLTGKPPLSSSSSMVTLARATHRSRKSSQSQRLPRDSSHDDDYTSGQTHRSQQRSRSSTFTFERNEGNDSSRSAGTSLRAGATTAAGGGRLSRMLHSNADREAVVAVERIARAGAAWEEAAMAAMARDEEGDQQGEQAHLLRQERRAHEARRLAAIETVKRIAAGGAAQQDHGLGTSASSSSLLPRPVATTPDPSAPPSASSSPSRGALPAPKAASFSPLLRLHLHHHHRNTNPAALAAFGLSADAQALAQAHREMLDSAAAATGQGSSTPSSSGLNAYLIALIGQLVYEEDADAKTRAVAGMSWVTIQRVPARPVRPAQSEPNDGGRASANASETIRSTSDTSTAVNEPRAPTVVAQTPETGDLGAPAQGQQQAGPVPLSTDGSGRGGIDAVWVNDEGLNIITRGLELGMRIALMEQGIELPDNVFSLTAVNIAGETGEEDERKTAVSSCAVTDLPALFDAVPQSASLKEAIAAFESLPLILMRPCFPLGDHVAADLQLLKAAAHAQLMVLPPTSAVPKETLPSSWMDVMARRASSSTPLNSFNRLSLPLSQSFSALPSASRRGGDAADATPALTHEELAAKVKRSLEKEKARMLRFKESVREAKRSIRRSASETSLRVQSMRSRIVSLLALPNASSYLSLASSRQAAWEHAEKRRIVAEEGHRIATQRNADYFLASIEYGGEGVDAAAAQLQEEYRERQRERAERKESQQHQPADSEVALPAQEDEPASDDEDAFEGTTTARRIDFRDVDGARDAALERAAQLALRRELESLGVVNSSRGSSRASSGDDEDPQARNQSRVESSPGGEETSEEASAQPDYFFPSLLTDAQVDIEKRVEVDPLNPLYLSPAVTGKSANHPKHHMSTAQAVLLTKAREQKRRQEEAAQIAEEREARERKASLAGNPWALSRRASKDPETPADMAGPVYTSVYTPEKLVEDARKREREEEKALGLAGDDLRRLTTEALRRLMSERRSIMAASGHIATIGKLAMATTSRPQSGTASSHTANAVDGQQQSAEGAAEAPPSALTPSGSAAVVFPKALMDVALISPSLKRMRREVGLASVMSKAAAADALGGSSPSRGKADHSPNKVAEGGTKGRGGSQRRLSVHGNEKTIAAATSALEAMAEQERDGDDDGDQEEAATEAWLRGFDAQGSNARAKATGNAKVPALSSSSSTPVLLSRKRLDDGLTHRTSDGHGLSIERRARSPVVGVIKEQLRAPAAFGSLNSATKGLKKSIALLAPIQHQQTQEGSKQLLASAVATSASSLPSSSSLGEVALLRHSVEKRRIREAVVEARKMQLETQRSAFLRPLSALSSSSPAAPQPGGPPQPGAATARRAHRRRGFQDDDDEDEEDFFQRPGATGFGDSPSPALRAGGTRRNSAVSVISMAGGGRGDSVRFSSLLKATAHIRVGPADVAELTERIHATERLASTARAVGERLSHIAPQPFAVDSGDRRRRETREAHQSQI